jgi:hypothetical protein
MEGHKYSGQQGGEDLGFDITEVFARRTNKMHHWLIAQNNEKLLNLIAYF